MRSAANSGRFTYGSQFFDYNTRVSAQSAERITAILSNILHIESVLDVGCALGTWLAAWRQLGVIDIIGIDGDYVAREDLQISPDRFVVQDVGESFDLQRKFDVVQCLEVAEHIASKSAAVLIENLTRHGAHVLFSAAPPGQGGEYHVNEQPYEYWRRLFRSQGYVALDPIRPRIRGDSYVAAWYRYNIFLYVRESALPQLPKSLLESAIPDSVSLADMSPLHYRIRKTIVRRMPFPVQQITAKILARTRRQN
jgi:SAM-dependent methyltransferase